MLEKNINALPDGFLWMRVMDTEPLLLTEEELNKQIIVL